MSDGTRSGRSVAARDGGHPPLEAGEVAGRHDFDHTYVLVSSLAGARAVVERMGFRPTPDGVHGSGLGTANTTIMMPDRRTYFELLAVLEPTQRNADKARALAERGNHLQGVAFDWPVAEAHAAFTATGIAHGEPIDFERMVDLADGPREARFSVALASPDAVRGVYIFAITHHSRDVVWRPDYLAHRNGALAVTALVGYCADVQEISQPWLSLFPRQATATRDLLSVRTATASVAFLTAPAYHARYGRDCQSAAVALEVIEVQVAEIGVARNLLDEAGINYALTPSGGVLTEKDAAVGISFHFWDASCPAPSL